MSTSLLHLVSPQTHTHTCTHARTRTHTHTHTHTAIGEDVAIDPSTVTRGRGNRVEFTCKLPSSKPQPSVRWMRNSTTINSTHSEILLSEDSSKLVLSDLKLEDAGTYTCEVMNIAGTRSATVNLTVQGKRIQVVVLMYIYMYCVVVCNSCIIRVCTCIVYVLCMYCTVCNTSVVYAHMHTMCISCMPCHPQT